MVPRRQRQVELGEDAGFAPANEDIVALEPMTAPADALRSGNGLRMVAPGESFSASFRIDVYG